MNGIIIVNQTIGHNQYKIDRLKEEAKLLGVHLDVFINNGTLSVIKNDEITINLPKADFVFYLDKDIYLARLCVCSFDRNSFPVFKDAMRCFCRNRTW